MTLYPDELDGVLSRAKAEGWVQLALLGIIAFLRHAEDFRDDGWPEERIFNLAQPLDFVPHTLLGLTQLTWLSLASNHIGADGTAHLVKLTRLTSLDLEGNNIGDEGAAHLADLDESTQLPKLYSLTSLNLWGNDIGPAGVAHLAKLTQLTSLNLGDNHIGDEGAEHLAKLTQLTSLNLWGNDIGPAGAAHLAKLTQLTLLGLGNCKEFTDAGAQFLVQGPVGRSLEGLWLGGSGVRGVPKELIDQGDAQAIFRAILDGLPLNEAKLVLVGQGAVGKSNIAKRLRALDLSDEEIRKLLDERGIDLRFNPNHDETQDFDIADWPVRVRRPGEDRDRDVRVRLLDFAGQDITHATHRFFLTARCVYLLVLDGTKSVQWNRLDYWLRLIWHYAGPSPVLVVVNKADLKPGIDLSELVSIVTNLAKVYELDVPEILVGISARTEANLRQLKDAILTRIAGMDTLDERVPRDFQPLRLWYDDPCNLETFEEVEDYEKRCRGEPFGIDDARRRRSYLGLMHFFASVFHWGDEDSLEEQPDADRRSRRLPFMAAQPRRDPWLAGYIFHPPWLKKRVYAVARDNKWIESQKGVLNLDRMRRVLRDQNLAIAEEHAQLEEMRMILSAMERFELCFPLGDGSSWLLPSCLSDDPIPPLGWQARWRLVGRFRFLPDSVIHRLIVRLHNKGMLLEGLSYWRLGCLARHWSGKADARVVLDRDARTITIETAGDEEAAHELTIEIKAELRDIHTRGAGVRSEEAIEWEGTEQPGETRQGEASLVSAGRRGAKVPASSALNFNDLLKRIENELKEPFRNSCVAILWGWANIPGFEQKDWHEMLDALRHSALDKEDLPFGPQLLPDPRPKKDETKDAALRRAGDVFRSHWAKLGLNKKHLSIFKPPPSSPLGNLKHGKRSDVHPQTDKS